MFSRIPEPTVDTINEGNYLYVINYQNNEEDLCALEMQSLFKITTNNKWFFSDFDINPSRSVFLKYRISILSIAETINGIEDYIEKNPLPRASFKFVYVNIDQNVFEYSGWKKVVQRICVALDDSENHDSPDILLSIIRLNSKWILGTCVKNDNEWKYHDYKPNTNSHSLGVRIARSIVNIAIENNKELSLVDPCCGVGTVVIEAASMGLNIRGYELNRKVAQSAIENLAFFGINNVIECHDMHTLQESFDVSIIDMPYGLFTTVSLAEQNEIIRTARRISKKAVIITGDIMDGTITNAGFNIINQCNISKGRLTRYITICS